MQILRDACVYHVGTIPNLPPLSHVRVFPRSSPLPILRINLDLLPKSFSSYLLELTIGFHSYVVRTGFEPVLIFWRAHLLYSITTDIARLPFRHLTIYLSLQVVNTDLLCTFRTLAFSSFSGADRIRTYTLILSILTTPCVY